MRHEAGPGALNCRRARALEAQLDSSYTKVMKRRSRRLAALARRVMRLPHNKPGTDKTFVHIAAHQHYLYWKAVRGS